MGAVTQNVSFGNHEASISEAFFLEPLGFVSIIHYSAIKKREFDTSAIKKRELANLLARKSANYSGNNNRKHNLYFYAFGFKRDNLKALDVIRQNIG